MKFINRIKTKLKSSFLDRHEKSFIEYCEKDEHIHPTSQGKILLDLFGDSSSISVYSIFVPELSRKLNSSVVTFSVRFGFRGTINDILVDLKYRRIYRAFNACKHLKLSALFSQFRSKARIKANELLEPLKDKYDLLNLTLDGICIGDLIYDSYLRLYNEPTVNIDDKRLSKKCIDACLAFYSWKYYLENNSITAIVISHEVYIEYGILVRLALSNDIPVYVAGDLGLFYLSREYPIVNLTYKDYKEIYKSFDQEKRDFAISWARAYLEDRLLGNSGAQPLYATQSAYGQKAAGRVLSNSNKFKVLIATHCFLDNPHGYRWMVYADFYEWIEAIGKLSEELDYEFYLKTHPDISPMNLPIIDDILKKFPEIKYIPPTTPHTQLIAEGIDAVLTVHGTIIHEYAYLNKKVLAAGDNPHINYNFYTIAKNDNEFRTALANLSSVNTRINKDDILEFVYMHYYHCATNKWFYRNFQDYVNYVGGYHNRPGSVVLDYFRRNMSGDERRRIINIINSFLESGAHSLSVDDLDKVRQHINVD